MTASTIRYFESKPAKSSSFRDVLYEKKDMIARITINRPEAYNAYTTDTLRELIQAFDDAASDDQVGVIVYTGAGDKAFCTGGDVKEYASVYTKRPRDYFKYMGLFSRYIESIFRSGKVVIARINGIAVGGGNESQLACDLAVMADDTYLGTVGADGRRAADRATLRARRGIRGRSPWRGASTAYRARWQTDHGDHADVADAGRRCGGWRLLRDASRDRRSD